MSVENARLLAGIALQLRKSAAEQERMHEIAVEIGEAVPEAEREIPADPVVETKAEADEGKGKKQVKQAETEAERLAAMQASMEAQAKVREVAAQLSAAETWAAIGRQLSASGDELDAFAANDDDDDVPAAAPTTDVSLTPVPLLLPALSRDAGRLRPSRGPQGLNGCRHTTFVPMPLEKHYEMAMDCLAR
eukprot:scaffold21749_cov49-Prasinocladus_malaysianus.AAC.3